MKKTSKKHLGSDFKGFLDEKLKDASFKREYEKTRLNLSLSVMVRRIMKHKKLSIRTLAKRMKSSVSQVQRLLSDENINLDTLAKFAAVTGKKLSINLK